MAVKRITIVLNTDTASEDCGNFTVDANGYNGKGCDVDVAAFSNLGTVVNAGKKPAWKQVAMARTLGSIANGA